MGYSEDIPDRYADQQRPEGPSLWAAIVNFLLVPVGTAIVQVPILICAYFIIGFVNQRLPQIESFKSFWWGTIAVVSAIGAWVCFMDFMALARAAKAYELGYRDWQTHQQHERFQAKRRRTEDAERRRLAQVEQERERARRSRIQQVFQLETLVLRAQAQHALDTDFFGTSTPASLLADFRQQLGRLALTDLGLLRESQNPVVRQIVGDGLFLPPTPPLRLPTTSPA